MSDDTKPRFSFEITESQRIRTIKHLGTYGLRKAIFGKILDDVLDMIEEFGGVAVGILMTEKVKSRDIIPTMQEVEKFRKEHKDG